MSSHVIAVEGVAKKFCKDLRHVMIYGATDIFMDFMGIVGKPERLRRGEFWALNGVSFCMRKGEILGIIGPNGSGKSTLLKMLNGIFPPDSGRIEIEGRVGALIEVGAGFHPLLTGRENIYINGAILGMTKREIDEKYERIVAFADIGEFIDAPVKHYSSGMYVRLGFSVAVHCEPEILLVDEVLAVGDARFFNKCTNKILELQRRGTTMILVTHNMWLVQTMCDRALVLDRGTVMREGTPGDCIHTYARLAHDQKQIPGTTAATALPVTILHADAINDEGLAVKEASPEDSVNLFADYCCDTPEFHAHFFIRVTTPDGYPLYTAYSERTILGVGEGTVKARIGSLSLLAGEYRLWIGVCGPEKEQNRISERAVTLTVLQLPGYPDPKYGLYLIKPEWMLGP